MLTGKLKDCLQTDWFVFKVQTMKWPNGETESLKYNVYIQALYFFRSVPNSGKPNYVFCILVRGCRPGKVVQMTEGEVKGLCLKSREIFLQQPILLELEAPLKICGELEGYQVWIIHVMYRLGYSGLCIGFYYWLQFYCWIL